MSARFAAGAIRIVAFTFTALVLVVLVQSLPWIGRTFPGFMLMANRVVPSIALPDWAGGRAPALFQHQVLAVDDRPVASAREVYDRVSAAPSGTAHVYRLRSSWGEERRETVASQTFASSDWVLLFGAYLFNGIVFVATGLIVYRLAPHRPASLAVLAATLSVGLFVLTAVDLYGPHWFFRLHVLGECLMGAALLHLALVFPTERLRDRRRRLLAIIYGGTTVLALVYEAVLFQPAVYTAIHLVALGNQVIGCIAMIAAVVYDFVASPSPLVRRRVGVVALGATGGMLLPALLWAASAVLGGGVSVNAAAFSAFLFPLSLGYAVVQHDLFEIDVVLRRSITYAVVVVAVAGVYIAFLALAGFGLGGPLGAQPLLIVALNVALLFALDPIRNRVQEGVDRLFFRRGYDPQAVVAALGHALENARQLDQVVAETTRAVQQTFFCRNCDLLVLDESGAVRRLTSAVDGRAVALPAPLRARLDSGRATSRYGWEDESDSPGRAEPWHSLAAEVLAPVRHGDRARWVLVLGKKESGRSYNLHDSALLETMARQIALALATAGAFDALERLNADLERQVEVRTSELEVANQELEGTVTRLRAAYALLEQSQRGLVRADRLATLGRLTAGIAHEVNTPLGAVMNSLRLLQDLGREYAESIDDPSVDPEDHRQIASEIRSAAADAAGWAERAANFVRRVKSHGREPVAGEVWRFAVAEVVEQVRCLMDHRLRASRCHLAYGEEPRGLELVGDPARLGHVLMNLIQNAVEAYDEQAHPDGTIEITARREGEAVVVDVRDRAVGVPAEIAERIFEELFTTKEAGRGTGLGLWIVRNLVEQSFRGEIGLREIDGPGSCFRLVLRDGPLAEAPQVEPSAAGSRA